MPERLREVFSEQRTFVPSLERYLVNREANVVLVKLELV